MTTEAESLRAALGYTRKERRHIAALDRRARWLEARTDGADLSYDLAEAAAIRWVFATLDAARAGEGLREAEYRECIEVRRLLGYLWTATGKNHLRPVSDLFAEDDPIVADVEQLGIFEHLDHPAALTPPAEGSR